MNALRGPNDVTGNVTERLSRFSGVKIQKNEEMLRQT